MINNKIEEYILCAAIHVDNNQTYAHQPKNIKSGIVVCGRRHHNIFIILNLFPFNYKEHKVIQGFLTSEDRFVDRHVAGNIAYHTSQTKEQVSPLFSEDLY